MYRKEVNERSPMRVLESSISGGLGAGNVGVVAARAGVGKTPLLVHIALDDLMRDRKVLHISLEQAVDHVRSYYDAIFFDVASSMRLEAPEQARVDVERNRLIFSHLAQARPSERLPKNTPSDVPPVSQRGDGAVEKIRQTVNFARDTMQFSPDAIVIDGFDFEGTTPAGVRALCDLAKNRSAELWISCTTMIPGKEVTGIPAPIDRFADNIAVVVLLEADRDHVRIRLLKDHDHEPSPLHLRLDPHSMRILDEDIPARSDRPRNSRVFRLHSGGAKGAEAAFGACAERYGMTELNYSFEGHRMLERARGVVKLSGEQLQRGDFSLTYASKRLGRVLSDIPLVRSVLQTIWHQINGAGQVFVVGTIQNDGTVRGGTGWGAELARLWKKPLFVYDQEKRGWFRWSGTAWEIVQNPSIIAQTFAGIGTQNLTEDGRREIEALYLRSFGEPDSV